MNNLIRIENYNDIPVEYQNTPIGLLLEYHNLKKPCDHNDNAELLVGMCIDYRKQLRIPNRFAYVIRSGGANLQQSDFHVSYVIAVGNVKYITLIGHNDCGMSNLSLRKEKFIKGLVNNAGWTREKAEKQFNMYEPHFEIGNEIEFILTERKRLQLEYPKVVVAPMLYNVEDNKLYIVRDNN